MTQEITCGKCKKTKDICNCGRPLKFKSVKELQKKIDRYFETATVGEYTITGLALALDTYRSVLIDYENRDEFSDAIKKAKTMIEQDYELSLRKSGRSGDIFGLKNFGWKDKTEVDQNNSGTIEHVVTGIEIK